MRKTEIIAEVDRLLAPHLARLSHMVDLLETRAAELALERDRLRKIHRSKER